MFHRLLKGPLFISFSTLSSTLDHCCPLLLRGFSGPRAWQNTMKQPADQKSDMKSLFHHCKQDSGYLLDPCQLWRGKKGMLCVFSVSDCQLEFKVGTVINSSQIYNSYHKLMRPIVFSIGPVTRIFLLQ